ncbi:MAG: TIGR03943 family protein [Elainellaceae cyanobacterium]
MTVQSRSNNPPRRRSPQRKGIYRLHWLLDVAALLTWGILLLKYWLTGKINVLLHPSYVWLAYSAGFALIGMGILKILQLRPKSAKERQALAASAALQHFSLFPPGFGSAVLLLVALFGLQFTPQPFASDVALNRGITETLTLTRSQPQAFRTQISPEKRSLAEWVRTLNVYPEPDAYTGQKVNVEGFVIHQDSFPQSYLILARFVITCCAADVYPIGLPVKLPSGDRAGYPADSWLRVEGEMITETLDGKRQLVIQANSLEEIEAPENPYDY